MTLSRSSFAYVPGSPKMATASLCAVHAKIHIHRWAQTQFFSTSTSRSRPTSGSPHFESCCYRCLFQTYRNASDFLCAPFLCVLVDTHSLLSRYQWQFPHGEQWPEPSWSIASKVTGAWHLSSAEQREAEMRIQQKKQTQQHTEIWKKARSILVYSKGRTWRDCFFRNHLCSVTCNFTAWTT